MSMKYLLSALFINLFLARQLFAKTITVSSISDMQTAINKAVPGDHIIVSHGVYTTTADILIDRVGTSSKPIILEAQKNGVVEITGSGGFNIAGPGAYIIIKGFRFTHAASKARMSQGSSFC